MATVSKGTASQQIERLFAGGSMAGLTDGQMLARFLTHHDEVAFAAIVERHGPMVLAVCRGVLRDAHDAEDAFQATFLTLVRRASSLWVGDSLGGWLHRVAFRVSLRAKNEAARRRVVEQKGGELAAARGMPERSIEDLRLVLLAEIDRLPQRLRLPLVLCDLQGLTRLQAADQLRWTEGTLRGRLTKARTLLRDRLGRRGVTLASVPIITLLTGGSSLAAVPTIYVRSLMKALTDSAIPATALALATRMAHSLSLAKWKGFAVALASAAVIVGALAEPMAPAAQESEPARKKGAEKPTAATASSNPRKNGETALQYSGRVVDPSGRPVAKAKLYVMTSEEPGAPASLRGMTGADGRFAFEVPAAVFKDIPEQFRTRMPVVAFADGFGFAFTDPKQRVAGRELTIKLVEDFPLKGRVLDLEGRPVPGAKVRTRIVWTSPEESLDPWIAAVDRKEGEFYALFYKYLRMGFPVPDQAQGPIPLVMTDDQGYFRLAGLGRERMAELHIQGPATRLAEVRMVTRKMPSMRVAYDPQSPEMGGVTIQGADAQFVIPPERRVEGVVHDRATGAPLAGMTVQSYSLAGDQLSNNPAITTVTDDRGHYVIRGMPRGSGNQLTVKGPVGSPYLPALIKVEDSPGIGPIKHDIRMTRGVLVEGRVLDKVTGKPVRSSISYHVALNNPHLADAPEFRDVPGHVYNLQCDTDSEGRFRCPALPGQGLLRVEAMANAYPRMEKDAQQAEKGYIPEAFGLSHAFSKLDIVDGVSPKPLEFHLDPMRTLSGTVLDPSGKPLTGFLVYGLGSLGSWSEDLAEEPTFQVLGIKPNRKAAGPNEKSRKPERTLVFLHEKLKLAAWRDIEGDESEPLSIKLEPWGAISGRVLDQEKKTCTDVVIQVEIAGKGRIGGGEIDHSPNMARTDEQGRFRVEGLAPGLSYRLGLWRTNSRAWARSVVVKPTGPGEARDLGDLITVFEKVPQP